MPGQRWNSPDRYWPAKNMGITLDSITNVLEMGIWEYTWQYNKRIGNLIVLSKVMSLFWQTLFAEGLFLWFPRSYFTASFGEQLLLLIFTTVGALGICPVEEVTIFFTKWNGVFNSEITVRGQNRFRNVFRWSCQFLNTLATQQPERCYFWRKSSKITSESRPRCFSTKTELGCLFLRTVPESIPKPQSQHYR